jgi:hypothetical protein
MGYTAGFCLWVMLVSSTARLYRWVLPLQNYRLTPVNALTCIDFLKVTKSRLNVKLNSNADNNLHKRSVEELVESITRR